MKGSLRYEIIDHIRTNAKSKNIYIDTINGHDEHIHCILSLNPDQTLSKVMQLLKGESSFWINKNSRTKIKFEWADEYFGISISESLLSKVREYIKNQDEHHMKMTWEEEYEVFMERYGFKNYKG